MARATTVKAISNNPYHNNGGFVVYGTVNSAVTAARGRSLVGYKDTFGGVVGRMTPVNSDWRLSHTFKAFSNGNYARMLPGKYIIRRVTVELAGLTNKRSIYMGPTNSFARPIHFRENRITEQVRAVTYDYVTGRPTTEPAFTLDDFGNDNAARPTRAIPGELVFTHGHRSGPRQVDYRPITSQ